MAAPLPLARPLELPRTARRRPALSSAGLPPPNQQQHPNCRAIPCRAVLTPTSTNINTIVYYLVGICVGAVVTT